MFWKVTDRWGNEIILTEERWQHIIEGHWELKSHRGKVLETIRLGRRKQDALDPFKYKYWRNFTDIPGGYSEIVVVVKLMPNKFVVTAYPK